MASAFSPRREPEVEIPAAYTITVTGDPLDDLRLDDTWDACHLGRRPQPPPCTD